MLSSVLAATFAFGASVGESKIACIDLSISDEVLHRPVAQSSPSVVCVAGQCLQGYSNTTREFSVLEPLPFAHHYNQLEQLSQHLGYRPMFFFFLASTPRRPTQISFMNY